MTEAKRLKWSAPKDRARISTVYQRLHFAKISDVLTAAAQSPNACVQLLTKHSDVPLADVVAFAGRYGLPARDPRSGGRWGRGQVCMFLAQVMNPKDERNMKAYLRAYAKWWSGSATTPNLAQARKIVRSLPGGSAVDRTRRSGSRLDGPFCGPAGGGPPGSYPVSNRFQTRAALQGPEPDYAPYPSGVRKCAAAVGRQTTRTRHAASGQKRRSTGRRSSASTNSARFQKYVDEGSQIQVPWASAPPEPNFESLIADYMREPRRK